MARYQPNNAGCICMCVISTTKCRGTGRDCTNSEAALFILGGVLQHKIQLQPGEKKEIHVLFGISQSCEKAIEVRTNGTDEKTRKKYSRNLKKQQHTIMKKSVLCQLRHRMKK